VPDSKCKFGFHAYDSDHTLNRYKICIQATYWNIQDDNMDLYYYYVVDGVYQKFHNLVTLAASPLSV
jgi:hypothetical protein